MNIHLQKCIVFNCLKKYVIPIFPFLTTKIETERNIKELNPEKCRETLVEKTCWRDPGEETLVGKPWLGDPGGETLGNPGRETLVGRP